MSNTIEALLNAGFELEYAPEDLAEPFGIRQDGAIATIEDAIRELAPEDVRAAFSLPTPDGTKAVKAMADLIDDELAALTLAILQDTDDSTALAAGDRSYTWKEIEEEVRQRTPMGLDQMEATRHHSQLLEAAIRRGRVKFIPVRPDPGDLEFPDL